jgi:tRNA(Ile)-lysidine synthase
MKLKKYFIDMKVPREERDAIPVVCGGNGDIIWVAGMRPVNRGKLRKAPKFVCILLIMTIKRLIAGI